MNAITPALLLYMLLTACTSTKKLAILRNDTYKNTYKTFQGKMLDDQTYQLDSISTDDTFGYSQVNPIHVGGAFKEEAMNQRRFLNALLGPGNEIISYRRRGSCCSFSTKNGMDGHGLLDIYEVTDEGLEKPILLYLNFYDYGILRAPKGFTFKK